jgi:hypothetical protein
MLDIVANALKTMSLTLVFDCMSNVALIWRPRMQVLLHVVPRYYSVLKRLRISKIKRKANEFGEELYSNEVKYHLSSSWFAYACGIPALSLFTAVDAYILLWITWFNCYNNNSPPTYCRYSLVHIDRRCSTIHCLWATKKKMHKTFYASMTTDNGHRRCLRSMWTRLNMETCTHFWNLFARPHYQPIIILRSHRLFNAFNYTTTIHCITS